MNGGWTDGRFIGGKIGVVKGVYGGYIGVILGLHRGYIGVI